MKLHEFNGVFMLHPEALPDDLDLVWQCFIEDQQVVVLPVSYYKAMLEHLPEGLQSYPVDLSKNPRHWGFVQECLEGLCKDQDRYKIAPAFSAWRQAKTEEYQHSKSLYISETQQL